MSEQYGEALKLWREHMDNAVLSGRAIPEDIEPIISAALTRESQIPALVAAAYEAAATIKPKYGKTDPSRLAYLAAPAIRALVPADASAHLDSMLMKARERAVADVMENLDVDSLIRSAREKALEEAAKECERSVPPQVLATTKVDPDTIVDQRSVLVCAARIRALKQP
jgi:hypothetical protein